MRLLARLDDAAFHHLAQSHAPELRGEPDPQRVAALEYVKTRNPACYWMRYRVPLSIMAAPAEMLGFPFHRFVLDVPFAPEYLPYLQNKHVLLTNVDAEQWARQRVSEFRVECVPLARALELMALVDADITFHYSSGALYVERFVQESTGARNLHAVGGTEAECKLIDACGGLTTIWHRARERVDAALFPGAVIHAIDA